MATFNAAFAAARKAGKKAFTWNGKRFNTKLSNGTPAKMKAPGSKPSRLPETVKAPGSRPAAKAAAAPSIKEGIAKAAVKSGASRSTKGKALGMTGNKLTIGDRIGRSIRVGKTAVDRGHRRDAAQKANAGAGAAVSKMLSGMDKLKKKK